MEELTNIQQEVITYVEYTNKNGKAVFIKEFAEGNKKLGIKKRSYSSAKKLIFRVGEILYNKKLAPSIILYKIVDDFNE